MNKIIVTIFAFVLLVFLIGCTNNSIKLKEYISKPDFEIYSTYQSSDYVKVKKFSFERNNIVLVHVVPNIGGQFIIKGEYEEFTNYVLIKFPINRLEYDGTKYVYTEELNFNKKKNQLISYNKDTIIYTKK